MKNHLKILILEDVPADAELELRELQKGGLKFVSAVVDNEADFVSALEDFSPDVILSDYSLPQFDGMAALKIARQVDPNIPFIIVTGSLNEYTAVDCIKAGADDYIIKEHIGRLVSAVDGVLKKKNIQREREEALENLRESEERFRVLVQSMNDIIFLLDKNQKFIGIFGKRLEAEKLKAETFLGKTWRDLFEKEISVIHEKANKEALLGEMVLYEWSFESSFGTRYFQTSLSPIKDEKGDITGIVGVERDLTENKLAEIALKESEAKFRNLSDKSFVGVYLIQDDKFRYVNTRLAEIFGYKTEDLIEKLGPKDVTHIEDIPIVKSKFEERLSGKIDAVHYEFRGIRKDKKIIHLEVYGSRTIYRGKLAVIGSLLDITERKKIAEALKASEEKYRNFVEQSMEGISLIQYDKPISIKLPPEEQVTLFYKYGYIAECNDLLAKMYGYKSKEELVGKRLIEIHGGSLSEDNKEASLRFIKNGYKATNVETIEVNDKGEKVYFLNNAVGVIEGEHLVANWGTQIDITERKKAEEALKLSASILKEIGNIVLVADSESKIIYASPSIKNVLGYKPEEVLGDRWWKVSRSNGKERKEEAKKIAGYALGKIPVDESPYERKVKHKDGSYRWILWQDSKGPGDLIIGVGHDITERRAAEEAFREQVRRNEIILQTAGDGFYVIDKKGNILQVNKAFSKMIGYSEEELLKMKVSDIDAQWNEEEILAMLKRLVEEGTSSFETKHRHKNGAVLDVEISTNVLELDKEKLIYCSVRDITGRKKAEEKIRRSERQFRLVWENSAEGMRLTDENGIMLLVNSAFCKMVGKTKNQLEGKPLSEIYRTGRRKEILKKHVERFRNGNVKPFSENYLTLWNGKKKWFEVSNSFFETEGNKLLLLAVFRDITERKKSEIELRKLSRAVEQSPSAIMITGTGGDIEYVNKKFTEVSGYTFEEVVGKNPRVLKSGETPDSEYKRLWQLIASGHEWKGEFHNKKKNGELFWEYAAISPITDAEGKITHFLAVKEDITARKMIETELIVAKEKAEESDRLKSEFLAQMSHEIRTPLNILLSYNSLFKEDYKKFLPKEAEPFFVAVDTAGKRLFRTIDLILNMAMVQTGRVEVSVESINLVKILHGLIKEFNQAAREKGLSLEFRRESQVTRIHGDDYVVTQIFQNLIDNAIKYTLRGKVEIIVYENNKKKVCVDVKDTGIGISKKYLPMLFQPFSQEYTGYSRKFEGNGLGLALVKKYADFLGARILVNSRVNKGSVFSVVFDK